MPQDANCPKCKHVFPVTEARHPFTVACPRCEGDLTVEFKKPATPPEPGEPHYELLVKPGALPGTGGPPSVPKRKPDDDDTRSGGSMMVVLLSGGLGLLFVLLGLGVTGWYLFTQVDISSGYVNRNNFNNNFNNNNRPGNNFNPTPVPNPGGGDVRPNPNPNPGGGIRPNPNPNPLPDPNPNPFPNPFPPEPPKPKDTFDLRPVNGRLDRITPPTDLAVNEPRTILLPGRAEHVAVGGGGRYIVFQFPQQRRLAVFDANTGDLLPNTGDLENGGLMAAGANKLVVPSNQRNKYRVLTLPGLERESEFELPIFHGARGLAMGTRTNGPVLAIDPFGETVLVDLTTGKAVEGSQARNECPQNQLRATADGKLFFAGNGYNDRDKFKLLDEQGKKWRVRDPDVAAAYISADGKKLYAKDKILTLTGDQLAGKTAGVKESVWYVPAVTATGDYFLSVYERKGQFPRTKDAIVVTLLRGTNVDAPVLTAWEGLPEAAGLASAFFNSTDVLDRHLFLIPEAKLFVILNKDRTRLVVRKLNI